MYLYISLVPRVWRRGEKRAKGRRSNTESLKPCNFVELRNAPPPWTTVNGRSAPTVSLSLLFPVPSSLLFLPAISRPAVREEREREYNLLELRETWQDVSRSVKAADLYDCYAPRTAVFHRLRRRYAEGSRENPSFGNPSYRV